jgi:hypothetical protein
MDPRFELLTSVPTFIRRKSRFSRSSSPRTPMTRARSSRGELIWINWQRRSVKWENDYLKKGCLILLSHKVDALANSICHAGRVLSGIHDFKKLQSWIPA